MVEVVKVVVSGARGPSIADIARFTGAFGALPSDSDAEVARKYADYSIEQNPNFKGATGDPGGNVMAVGTVSDVQGLTVPTGAKLIALAGNQAPGDGGAGKTFALAPGATGPLVLTDKAGKKFFPAGVRHDLGIWVDDFGAVPDGVTDCTAAINDAIAFALANSISCVRFRRGVYYCSGQIVIANPGNGQAFLNIIELVGASCPAMIFGTVGTFPLSNVGTVIRSAAQSGSAIGVAGYSGSNFPPFAIGQVVFRNLTVRTYDNPRCHGINAENACQLVIDNVNIDTGVYSVQASKPTHNTWGLRTPARYNGALIKINNLSVSGYFVGADVNEHTNWSGGQLTANQVALEFKGADHSSRLIGLAIQRCPTVVYGNPGQSHRTVMIGFTIEHAGDGPDQHTAQNAWQITTKDVEDEANAISGEMSYTVVKGGVGDVGEFFKQGGANLQTRRIGTNASGSLSIFTTSAASLPSGALTKLSLIPTGENADFSVDAAEGPNFPAVYCTNAGTYSVSLQVPFQANGTGVRQLVVRKNGAAVAVNNVSALTGFDTYVMAESAGFNAAAGDKIEVFALQNSGAGLSTLPSAESNSLFLRRVR